MGLVVICTYRPKPDKERELLELLKVHVPTLRGEKLITEHPPFAARAADGTILEIFEWTSEEAKRLAHENAAVRACWSRFDEVADFVTLDTLAEAKRPFADFTALEI